MGYGLDDRGSIPSKDRKTFLYSTASRLVLGRTQPPTRWVPRALSPEVKRPGRENGHSPPSSAEIKNDGPIPPFPHTQSWHSATPLPQWSLPGGCITHRPSPTSHECLLLIASLSRTVFRVAFCLLNNTSRVITTSCCICTTIYESLHIFSPFQCPSVTSFPGVGEYLNRWIKMNYMVAILPLYYVQQRLQLTVAAGKTGHFAGGMLSFLSEALELYRSLLCDSLCSTWSEPIWDFHNVNTFNMQSQCRGCHFLSWS
jgi:hypothetical protein